MGVKTAHLCSGDDGVCAIQQLGATADTAHETIAVTADAISRWTYSRQRADSRNLIASGGVRKKIGTVRVASSLVLKIVQLKARVLENIQRVAKLNAQSMNEFAIILRGEWLQIAGIERIKDFDAVRIGRVYRAVHSEQVVTADGTQIRHRLLTAQTRRQIGLKRDTGKRVGRVPARLDHSAVPDSAGDVAVRRGAIRSEETTSELQ